MSDDSDNSPQPTVADDILWGTQAIADFLGQSLHEVQYLIKLKKIPVGRLGAKTIFASKKQLRKYLMSKTAVA